MPQRDPTLHTCADYLGWPEDVRYELIDGLAYLMSPAPDVVGIAWDALVARLPPVEI